MQYALQSKFPVANASSALKNFAIELGKVSNDVRLMASGPIAGLSELQEYQQFMPVHQLCQEKSIHL